LEPDIDTIAKAWIDSNGNGLIDDDELVDCVMNETSTGVYVSNGELHFNDGDTFGNQYLLVETKAPDGYFFVNDDGTFTDKCTVKVFKIDAADTTAADFVVGSNEFTIRNQTGTVIVNKVNDEGQFLTGAEFTIYADAECTEVVGKLIEDAANHRYYYKTMDRITAKFGDVYVIPSSVHETLIVPKDAVDDVSELERMVRDVNASEVRPEDQLSNNVYEYDSETHTLKIAGSGQTQVTGNGDGSSGSDEETEETQDPEEEQTGPQMAM